MNGGDFFNDLMGKYTGDDGKEYRCNQCSYPLEKIMVSESLSSKPRKLFYCTKRDCSKFGLVTVVAKVK